MQYSLSIIIPTHQRPQILRRTLDCIAGQTLLRSADNQRSRQARSYGGQALPRSVPFEVIIISDGPDEQTAEMLLNLTWPFEIQYFAVPKSQQGFCRNRGFEKARGETILFIGDDIFLAPDACERHLRAHERSAKIMTVERNAEMREFENAKIHEGKESISAFPHFRISALGIAVLGFTTWDPSLTITPLMKWMEQSGVQFGYPKIEKYRHQFLPPEIQRFFAYTSHISLSARTFHKFRFREDVSLYGWEDIEWGSRLAAAGIPLFYEPDAKAYHHHAFTDAEVWARSELLGRSAVHLERLVPGINILPQGWKKMAHWLESWLPIYRGKHWRAFLRGVRKDGKDGNPLAAAGEAE